MKTCCKCKIPQSRSEFYAGRTNPDGLSRWCKTCESEKAKRYWSRQTAEQKAEHAKKAIARYRADPETARALATKWRRKNPAKHRRYRRKSVLKRRYGLTEAAYQRMLGLQHEKCAICKRHFKKTPHVDHCHETGKVRGLLCSPCNTALGKFQDSEQVLFKAIEYLRNSK